MDKGIFCRYPLVWVIGQHLPKKLSPVVIQRGHHFGQLLPGPLWEGGLVVGHGGDSWPGRLIRSTQGTEDSEQLIDLGVTISAKMQPKLQMSTAVE